MKRIICISVFVSILTVLVSSCYTTYSISLNKVESPENAKLQYGETKIVSIDDKNMTKYKYEDDFINITWYTGAKEFNFYILNKSKYSLKILWDEMAYVDIYGRSSRIMHSGIKYSDRNNSMPASVVPKESYISDVVVPTDNIYLDAFGEWRTKPLLPQFYSKKEINDSGVVGESIKIVFPIIIENVTNEYVFEFRVDNAKIDFGNDIEQ